MPEYHTRDGISAAELAQLEAKLQEEGYRLTAKTNEKELLPKEYLKRPHGASANSFGGPNVWLVVWCIR